MDHKVQNVTQLYEDASNLIKKVCQGGEANSADGIINNLSESIENLKNSWEGRDAGKQIQNIVEVHNAMVNIRNVLAKLAADASGVGSNYREIQNANGAGLESLPPISADEKGPVPEYSDDRDTIGITDAANIGKQKIDTSVENFEAFVSSVQNSYDQIMSNWQTGTGREQAQAAFDDFMSNAAAYKAKLAEASQSISTAITNYKF